MAFVVAEPCIACKYTDCVAVCPVECFREGKNFLVIDPDVCIDCGACVPECPTEAIFDQDELPEKWSHYLELNAELSQDWAIIDAQQDPMDGADDMKDVEKKEHMLDRASA